MKSLFGIIIGVLGIIIGILLYNSQSTIEKIPIYKMSSTKSLKAFVLGGTGTTGKAIIKALVENTNFEKVTIIGRRNLELPNVIDNPNYSKFDQKIIDFEDSKTYIDTFQGYDIGFCALGTSSVGLTNEQYHRVTHDYVVDTAKMAKAGGCQHFHLVSGRGTSKTSLFYWARTKAEVEEKITQMEFERLSIYRPAGIIKDKNEVKTMMESAGICAFKILDPFGLMSVDSLRLGNVIVNNTFRVIDSKNEILENADILKLGKEFK